MARGPSKEKLAKLALKLVQQDLKRIQAFKVPVDRRDAKGELVKDSRGHVIVDFVDPPPGMFALTLTRYVSALMNVKRTTDKLEDETRKLLKKLTTKQLEELAGVKKG